MYQKCNKEKLHALSSKASSFLDTETESEKPEEIQVEQQQNILDKSIDQPSVTVTNQPTPK